MIHLIKIYNKTSFLLLILTFYNKFASLKN